MSLIWIIGGTIALLVTVVGLVIYWNEEEKWDDVIGAAWIVIKLTLLAWIVNIVNLLVEKFVVQ